MFDESVDNLKQALVVLRGREIEHIENIRVLRNRESELLAVIDGLNRRIGDLTSALQTQGDMLAELRAERR